MDQLAAALQSLGILPKPKLISPLASSESPGGINNPTQTGLNYYYQRELNPNQLAGQLQPSQPQQQNFGQNAIQQAINLVGGPNVKAQAQGYKLTDRYNNGFVMSTPNQYVPVIDQAAQNNGVPQSILSSAINQESGFNPDVISGKKASSSGALGIAQFMPATAKGMGIDPLDPNQAINGMAKLLSSYKNKFGSWDLALAAYNAGPGAVQQYNGIPPFKETQNYVKNILANAHTTFRKK